MITIIFAFIVLFACFLPCSLLEFTGWPGVCRVYPGGSCTLQWTVKPAISAEDYTEQIIYYGLDTVFLYQVVTYITGLNVRIGQNYDNRSVTYTGGGELVGFTLHDIRSADGSNYTCQYNKGNRPQNSNGVIFVWGPPPTAASLTQTPSQVTVGETVTYTCDVSSTSKPAAFRPKMTYTWYVNGTKMQGHTSHTFSINTVTRAQWGNRYSCTGRETGSTYSSSKSGEVALKPRYPPGPATATPRDVKVVEPSPVTLRCSLSDPGYPAGSFTWTRLSDNQVVTSCTTETCQISDTRAGIYRYQCTPYNVIRSGGGATVNITVVYLDLETVLPSTTTVVTSQTLNVTCSVRAFPAGDVTWTYNGSASLPAAVRMTSPSTTPDDNKYVTQSMIEWSSNANQEEKETTGGNYSCAANNGVGLPEITSTTQLIVQFPPRAVTTSPVTQKTAYRKGEDVTFSLNVTASPRPNSYIWRFISKDNNEGGLPGNAKLTNGNSTLTLTSVTEDNIGKCICVVDNGVEDDLIVEFYLAAESVPDTPTDLKLSRATSVSLAVGWSPGWDGGAKQTFKVTYTNSQNTVRQTEVTEVPWIKITNGIKPDTEYGFEVQGRNKFGDGTASTAVFRSQAQSYFDVDTLEIEVYSNEGYALLRGSIQKGTVTHMVVDACQTRPPGPCISNNITQVSLSRRRRSLPVGELISAKLNITEGGSEYQFDISLYDGPDLVNSQTTTAGQESKPLESPAEIAGGVVAVLLVVGIIAVIVFFIRRRKGATKKGKAADHGRKLVKNNKDKADTAESAFGGYDNCGANDNEISPYGETGAQGLVRTINGSNNRHGFDVYAEVKKEKKNAKGSPGKEEIIYAHPNKKIMAAERGEVISNSVLDEDTVLVENTTYAEKPEGKNKPKQIEEGSIGLYAEVGHPKNSSRPPLDQNKDKALKRPVITTGSKPAVARKPKHVSKDGDDMAPRYLGDNPYQNVEDLNSKSAAYGNVNPANDPTTENCRQQTVGADGIVYSELSFENHEPQLNAKISAKRKDESTTYASIDIDKTGKPTIGPRTK